MFLILVDNGENRFLRQIYFAKLVDIFLILVDNVY